MKLLLRLIIATLAVLVAANILPGVYVDSVLTALIVAVVFGVLNAVVKPILAILTLPLTILTLGLFLLVLNVFLVYLTAAIVPGFRVDGFLQALLFGLIVAIVSGVLEKLL